MSATLTRTQLAALARTHQRGAQWEALRGRRAAANDSNGARFSRATLAALVAADVARREAHASIYGVLPVLHTWADGYGTWYVAVPWAAANGEAVARAVIAGEVWARNGQAYVDGWYPRVRLVRADVGHDIYEEV